MFELNLVAIFLLSRAILCNSTKRTWKNSQKSTAGDRYFHSTRPYYVLGNWNINRTVVVPRGPWIVDLSMSAQYSVNVFNKKKRGSFPIVSLTSSINLTIMIMARHPQDELCHLNTHLHVSTPVLAGFPDFLRLLQVSTFRCSTGACTVITLAPMKGSV